MGHLPGLAYRALADEHWTALFVSKGIEDLTGYPPDDFTSRRLNYNDIMLPEDRPATREAVFTALRERRMYEDEHRIRHKDGSVRWIWGGHGVFAPDGSLRFIEGLNLDITRRSRPRRSCGRVSTLAQPDRGCRNWFGPPRPTAPVTTSARSGRKHWVPASQLLGWRWLEVLHPTTGRLPGIWTDSVAGRRL